MTIPLSQEIPGKNGALTLQVFPGLARGEDGTQLRRYPTSQEAWTGHREGLGQILSHVAGTRDKTFAWLPRDIRLPQDLLLPLSAWCKARAFEDALFRCAQDWCFEAHLSLDAVRSPKEFEAALEACSARVRTVRAQSEPFVRELVKARQEFEAAAAKAPRLAVLTGKIRERLWPTEFPAGASWSAMVHVPRWFRAAARRLTSAHENPGRDQARAAEFAPFVKALEAQWSSALPPRVPGEIRDPDRFETLQAAAFLLEELRVLIWAQELGTSAPASLKRVREQFAQMGIAVASAG
jgi:ATP-dependent helicase HrpA